DHGPFVSIDVMLTWATNRFAVVEVAFARRAAGTSSYTLAKLLSHAFTMITGYGGLPLRAVTILGVATAAVGLPLLVWVVGRYLVEGTEAPGFPFLASIIIIFSGSQLVAIGIIGEYLLRIHFRTMGKPSYVVREHTVDSAADCPRPGAH